MTFPAITVGLSMFLAGMYAAYVRTGREIYLTIYRFWLRIFAVGFAPRRTRADDAVIPLPSRLAVKALRLEWLRNVGWIAVWTVLFFLCLNSLGGVLSDDGDLLGVVLLIAAMVAVWIVTDRRDAARQTTLGQAGPVVAK